MDTQERLDRHAGDLRTLTAAFALLVEHLGTSGALSKPAFINDLQRLSEHAENDPETRAADQRLLRTLREMDLSD